jgi:hypothetical protein
LPSTGPKTLAEWRGYRNTPWRKPHRIDQLIDHGAIASFGALLEDGREASGR